MSQNRMQGATDSKQQKRFTLFIILVVFIRGFILFWHEILVTPTIADSIVMQF
jgi:hypothetical protein